MAIAFDASSTSITNGFAGTTTTTWSHTTGSGSDRILWLHVGIWQDVAGTGTITAASYNGVALTKYVAKNVTGGAMRAELWYLINPATGTNTMSVTLTGNHDAKKYAVSTWTGVDQTTGVDASNSAEGGASPITVDVTTVADNCMVVDACADFTTAVLTIGAGQTSIMNDSTGSTGMAASYEGPKTPAGAVTMSWTKTGTADWAQVAASFKPATAVTVKQLAALGVG